MLDSNLKILIFSLHNEHFATDISQVERIIGYEEPTVLPDAPSYIQGVIKHEERILPILNLNSRFGYMSSDDQNKKIIVVKREEKKFGIIVDNVYEVKDIDRKLLEDVPDITLNISDEYIKGLIKLEDRIVILLDLDKILSSSDEGKIF